MFLYVSVCSFSKNCFWTVLLLGHDGSRLWHGAQLSGGDPEFQRHVLSRIVASFCYVLLICPICIHLYPFVPFVLPCEVWLERSASTLLALKKVVTWPRRWSYAQCFACFACFAVWAGRPRNVGNENNKLVPWKSPAQQCIRLDNWLCRFEVNLLLTPLQVWFSKMFKCLQCHNVPQVTTFQLCSEQLSAQSHYVLAQVFHSFPAATRRRNKVPEVQGSIIVSYRIQGHKNYIICMSVYKISSYIIYMYYT